MQPLSYSVGDQWSSAKTNADSFTLFIRIPKTRFHCHVNRFSTQSVTNYIFFVKSWNHSPNTIRILLMKHLPIHHIKNGSGIFAFPQSINWSHNVNPFAMKIKSESSSHNTNPIFLHCSCNFLVTIIIYFNRIDTIHHTTIKPECSNGIPIYRLLCVRYKYCMI